jgi:Mycothiol maleylpyruvate isomerase N-terminal domain
MFGGRTPHPYHTRPGLVSQGNDGRGADSLSAPSLRPCRTGAWSRSATSTARKPRAGGGCRGYPRAAEEHPWQTAFVQNPVNRLDAVFPIAATVALDLIERGEVRDQWLMPSALPKMSTGTLACHLGRQVVRAAEVLPVATDIPPLESVDAHYHRAAWVMSTSPDDPSNDRSTDEAEAALGAAALAGRSAGALATVRRLLAGGAASDVVLIPWQGWSLRRDDFLLTRMLEIVVHADDLALSAGIRTPEFPAEVFAPVSDLLVRLAVKRHGQSAVISTLTRSERTQAISAF